MSLKVLLKSSFAVLVTILLVFALIIASSIVFPRFTTSLFFGVNTGPVMMEIRDQFAARETDKQTRAIVQAANRFLAALDETQRAALQFDFTDNQQRANWSNFPEGMIPRAGLRLGQLNQKQQLLLDQLLQQLMSEKGFLNLQYQLTAEETFPKDSFNKYGIELFYIAILGEPSETLPWMFQFGGHHLAINTTIYGADTTFSPMLTGGQPLHINYQGQRIFVTAEETKAAQALLSSLSPQQRKIAIRSDQSIDLLLGPGEYGAVIAPEGIPGKQLNDQQKQLLIDLINSRLSFINHDDHLAAMDIIQQDLDKTHFAWWGPIDRLGFAYFRVTGPSVVLEYAPQDDDGVTQTDHAHSIYRNPLNDYGKAWISQ